MNNVSKLLMVILMVVTAVLVVELADHPSGEDGTEERASFWGNDSLDTFMSEFHSYENSLMFIYIPRNPSSTFDCYMTYELREDGNTLESVDKKLYKNVSAESPIVLEFSKKKDSIYKLEATIKDKSGINMHKSEIEINPESTENKSER